MEGRDRKKKTKENDITEINPKTFGSISYKFALNHERMMTTWFAELTQTDINLINLNRIIRNIRSINKDNEQSID